MKINGILSLSLIICIAINFGCSKSETTLAGIGSLPASTDPAIKILGRWQVIKDSIVAVNFAFPSGEVPISSIYRGRYGDNWNFQENGTVLIYQGGPVGSIEYVLLFGNNLLMPAFEWGNVTVLTLTHDIFIWEKAINSSNGGRYYRRAYFRR
jgi:hypothetical protein